ncbi:MAG: response regulator transcription factor [Clostridia bacterium]|nr:response regulator transcription factor [Clostridia bacterium]
MNRIQDARILLVDDEADLLALLRESLSGAGYRHLTVAASAAEARAAFALERPDFIVLDINLPDGDGFSLFQAFREKADVPVLFLSARDADSDRLFGLGLGADDYLTKPFLTQELLLRIATILRRTYRAELSRGEEAELSIGASRVNLSQAVVLTPRGPLQLTATERALLQKLAENRGRIVTYDALCEAVWGEGYYGYENSLNVHLRHLREKLEENPSRPRFLITVRGLGYKLQKEETP